MAMRVLAIDTALGACSAAVFDTGHGGVMASESLAMDRGHAEAVVPLVARVVKKASLRLSDCDRVVVTTGPGSFTGLRVGIAAARGIALAAALPIVGVSTLWAFAAPLFATDDKLPVLAVIDARHQHVYMQMFGAGSTALGEPRLAPLAEAVRTAGDTPIRIVGSAARPIAEALIKAGRIPAAVVSRAAPDIAWVAQIGSIVPENAAPPIPLYLRPPDAQPQNASHLPRR